MNDLMTGMDGNEGWEDSGVVICKYGLSARCEDYCEGSEVCDSAEVVKRCSIFENLSRDEMSESGDVVSGLGGVVNE